jgi:hypothetical protein
MTERFNSGHGGYTCDHCGRLLWSGMNGAHEPGNRLYIYGADPEHIVQRDGRFFCDDGCAIRDATPP